MQESSSRMPLTKVRATVLGLVHLLNTCASVWRLRYDVVGKAATPKNARHRERTANRDMVNSCATEASSEEPRGSTPRCQETDLDWRPYNGLTAFRNHQFGSKFEIVQGPAILTGS